MIKSCAECQNNCCRVGPGPYKSLPFNQYYVLANTPYGYNTKCRHHDLKTGKCRVWETDKLPIECRYYVCNQREFSSEELEAMKKLAPLME